jgi:hypothetical protein
MLYPMHIFSAVDNTEERFKNIYAHKRKALADKCVLCVIPSGNGA